MSNLANIKDLLSAGKTEDLILLRDEELQRYRTNKLILDTLKSGMTKTVEGSTPNLTKALKILSVQDYIKLENGQSILGLNDLKINLSYTEKKTIRSFLIYEIKKNIIPILEYINAQKKEYPDILNLDEKRKEILVLEEKRRSAMLRLIEIKTKKIKLVQSILDIKLGPHLESELKLLSTEHKLNHQKIQLLNQYMAQEFEFRSEFMEKAVKEILKYIEIEIENNCN